MEMSLYVVDGVMVSADNVVQCGQATVTWAGTTVCHVSLYAFVYFTPSSCPAPHFGLVAPHPLSFMSFHKIYLPTIMIHRNHNPHPQSQTYNLKKGRNTNTPGPSFFVGRNRRVLRKPPTYPDYR